MRVSAFLLQFSREGYRAAVYTGLEKAFAKPTVEKTLPIESAPPIIIFSDLHKGARNGADDYWRCERAYRAALEYYYAAGYDLYVLGDAEELWENRPHEVLAKHAPTLGLEAKFHAENRYVRFWGNHDIRWRDPEKVRSGLGSIFRIGGGEPLEVREALKLRVERAGEELGMIFLVHGHQGTFFQ